MTPSLERWLGSNDVATAAAFPVTSFGELVQQVAQLSYLNKDHLLFYRGQPRDYLNKAGASTFYPRIYRGERLPKDTVSLAFDVLETASQRLCDGLFIREIRGHRDVRRRKYIQWSILQHYEVCPTPLLDLTQSLLVACSFAFLEPDAQEPYVFVFGLPYITNRVSVNSEHDLVMVRLLSICPPEALRPYHQEGYVAGTDEVTTNYDSKSELDFNNRLIAKFRLRGGSQFWKDGFAQLPRTVLYPEQDAVQWICDELRQDLSTGLTPGRVGAFLEQWHELETALLSRSRASEGRHRVYSTGDALAALLRDRVVGEQFAVEVDQLRGLRNRIIHEPINAQPEQVARGSEQLLRLLREWRAADSERSL